MIKTVPLTGRAGSPKLVGNKGSPKAAAATTTTLNSTAMGSPRMRRNNSGSFAAKK